MDFMKANKAAWEEAFDNRHEGWCADMAAQLKTQRLPYMTPMLRDAMQALDLQGKTVAQFCCNNGRELLSSMQLGPANGVGFDIAENMIREARAVAAEAQLPCTFHATNILDIGEEYTKAFDLVMFTVGAITWFQNLPELFGIASRCLKPGGQLLIHDFHPLINMLPLPGEEAFDPAQPNRIAYSYFRTEPWLEQNSGGYMTHHKSKSTFTSFSHTMSSILNAIQAAGMQFISMQEYDKDIGMTDAYDGLGFPLSFTLLAAKLA